MVAMVDGAVDVQALGCVLVHEEPVVLVVGILHAGGHVGPGELLSGGHLLVDHVADVVFGVHDVGLLAEGGAEHIELLLPVHGVHLIVNGQVRHIFQS